MIATILKISWLNLRRDRAAYGLMFVLPIVFFSIFALIFGATDRQVQDSSIKVTLADLDRTDISRRFIAALQQEKALDVKVAPDAAAAKQVVHDGKAAIALVLQSGFGADLGDFSSNKQTVDLIYDAANPVARSATAGLLQAAAAQAAFMLGNGGTGAMPAMVRIHASDVREGETAVQHSMIAYYAAGIGVMFLLFSMAARGGALLDEQESGTLDRLLTTNASMSKILAGKWLFLAIAGSMQVTLMFLWAAAVFHLQLFTLSRFCGFAVMAIVTAGAAAAFGLVLATACKTREQLSGISTIVILIMSALGGSMVPRFIMPKFMETTSLFTFNGWALDGFLKVFWYDRPGATVAQTLVTLVPQLAVLTILAGVFLVIARVLARRWETA